MIGRYERVEVITARRRRWNSEEKLRIAGDLSRPRASVSSVARNHEVNPESAVQVAAAGGCGFRQASRAVHLRRPVTVLKTAG
jgi:hypothetical protein